MNEEESSQAKATYIVPIVAPTKMAPKVAPRDGMAGEGFEDITG